MLKVKMTGLCSKKNLIDFENDIASTFNAGKIQSPIHLYSNNEDFLIKFFKRVKKNDWVFCSWRSHYQCLLKGVPPKKLKKEIIDGKSISLCFPKYKIYSSAIVGGILPISVGLALSLKRKKSKHKVYCFLGDMTSETRKAWSLKKLSYEKQNNKYITFYKYKLKYPHAGAGKRVQF